MVIRKLVDFFFLFLVYYVVLMFRIFGQHDFGYETSKVGLPMSGLDQLYDIKSLVT